MQGKITYHIVELVVALLVHPPLEWKNQEEHLDEVERSDEDVLVGSANELHRLLREESHVLVDSVLCDVFVGRVVESDEDVEQDDHDDKGKDVVEDDAERRLLLVSSCLTLVSYNVTYREVVEAFKLRRLHDGVQHGLEHEDSVVSKLIVRDVQTNEGLEETNHDNE